INLNRRYIYKQINPIQNWPRHPLSILGNLFLTTSTLSPWVTQISTGARVYRRNQRETSRIFYSPCCPHNFYNSILHWLAQSFQYSSSKLRHFIQKQHSQMGQTHLAWRWI